MTSAPENYIAIVGMSCRFAGCRDLKAYWLRILTGESAFSGYPNRSAERYLLEPTSSFRNITTLEGGYLQDLWQVRTTSLSLPQGALPGTNPEYPLASELAMQAIKDAGATAAAIARDRIGVVVGYSPAMDPATIGWCQHGIVVDQTMELIRRCFPHATPEQFDEFRVRLIASLPEYDSRNIASLFHQTLASTIADRCDISGPAFCVDRGSISSQVAIVSACDALTFGRADLFLAGAIQGLVTPPLLMPYSRMGVLSKTGSVRPFGQMADGTLLGEGGGFVVLKRLSDAIRAGDRIYAIVKSCGISSDGNAHRVEGGLATAIRHAWAKDVSEFETLDMVEANGTGIATLDRAEYKTLSTFLGSPTALPLDTIAIGSVKALIGHCEAASGIAGTIKAALALRHRIIPPAQEAQHPASDLKFPESPFYLNPRPRPWVHNDAGAPRRAAINSLSINGGAAHLVLEQSS